METEKVVKVKPEPKKFGESKVIKVISGTMDELSKLVFKK